MTVGMETPNDLMVAFSNTVSTGFATLQGPVNGIFGLMIALVVALTGIQWALSPHRDLLALGFGKVLLIGAFAYLINDWKALSETIQAGFIDLGLSAGGGELSRADFLNPGAVLERGWEIVKALGETSAPLANPIDLAANLMDALILGLAMIGVMLAFSILALQIIVTLLEFKIVTLGGFVLLPFGIWSKSAFLAERPLGYVVASGLKVLALAIVISGATSVFDQLQPSGNPDLYEALAILAAALLLAMLALFIPNLAAALVTGGPALGAGAAITGGLAVAAGGALVGAGAAGAAVLAGRAAGRMASTLRTAAGAGADRPAPASPPGAGPSAPPSIGSGPGGARPPGGPRPSPDDKPAGPQRPSSSGAETPVAQPQGDPDPHVGTPGHHPHGRSPQQISGEAEAARAAFLRAARRPAGAPGPGPGARSGRSAILQAFFTANAGRALLPGSETSGSLSPQLKPEEP